MGSPTVRATESITALYLPKKTRAEFTCPLCGHTAPVEFTDPNYFDEPEPLPSRNRWALEAAIRTAQERLDKNARARLRLVRCPACEKRDPRGLRRATLSASLPLLALSPALFTAIAVGTSLLFPGLARSAAYVPVIVGAAVVAAVSPLIVWRRRRRMIAEADTAIRFLPPANPES